MNFDGTEINLLIAFLGGILTFFASCFLPLVPVYLAYLSGISLSEKKEKRHILLNSLLFTLGFILVFVILGLSASTLGLTLSKNRLVIQRIGGVFFVLMGVFMLGFIKPVFLLSEKRFNLRKIETKWLKLNSFLAGLTFGFAWSPCVGPVLGVILFWASQADTAFKGTLMLLVYGIGLGIPFLITGAFFEKIHPYLKRTEKFGKVLNNIAAVLIIFAGVLLVLNKIHIISFWLIRLLGISTLSI